MKKMNTGWLIGLMAMAVGILGPTMVGAEETVSPVPADAGPVETGMTLAQAKTATGSQNFAMQGNLAVAAALAFAGPSSGEPQVPSIPKAKPPQPVDEDGNLVPPSPGPKPKQDPPAPPSPVGPPLPVPSPKPSTITIPIINITITIPTITIIPLPDGPTLIEVDMDGDGIPEYIITIGPGIFDIGKPVIIPPGGFPPSQPPIIA